MEVGKLTVQARETFGKGASRRYRAKGLIPGICYGHQLEKPVPFVVDPKSLKGSLDPVKRRNTVIEVTVQGASTGVQNITAMLKDTQIDAIRRDLTHVDLIAIDVDKMVEVEIPVVLTGKSVGVVDGGILNLVRRKILVECKPTNIPTEFAVDVTSLSIGDVLHVSDLQFPEGVSPALPPRLTIVTCVAPQEEESKPSADEGAVAAAGDAGEAKKAEAKKAEPKKAEPKKEESKKG
jgi:large subunit ribosomal protein L25